MAQMVWKVNVVLPSTSTLVDNVTHSFIIEQTGSSTDLVPASVLALITSFYNTSHATGASPLCGYLNKVVSRSSSGVLVTGYDITTHLDGSKHGAPVWMSSFTLGAAVGGGTYGWPEGLCALLSYRADYGSDVEFAPGARPRSRDRGRLYFGPVAGQLTTLDGSNRCIWDPAQKLVAALEGAYLSGTTYGGASDVPAFVQWSRKASRVQHITTVWTQDCPRYQRRRVDPGNKE